MRLLPVRPGLNILLRLRVLRLRVLRLRTCWLRVPIGRWGSRGWHIIGTWLNILRRLILRRILRILLPGLRRRRLLGKASQQRHQGQRDEPMRKAGRG